MKKILYLFNFLFFGVCLAQSPTENYIKTSIRLSADNSEKSESIQYLDGLGRLTQSIVAKGSPTGKDIVSITEYDDNGRALKNYLPIPIDQTGLSHQTVTPNTINTYYNVANAYSENVLDASPLGRVTESSAPGDAWKIGNNHTKSVSYSSNNANEVIRFGTSASYTGSLLSRGISYEMYYPANQLAKNTATDEDGQTSIEYKNSRGQTVLMRRVVMSSKIGEKGGSTPTPVDLYVDTYNIYNKYGQLVYVIPPLAVEKIKSQQSVNPPVLDDLCYQYIYDDRNRLVKKKLPDKGWESMVYDRQDRLVATQDANMALDGKWFFTKYDKFGRVVYTGKFSGGTREAVQTAVNQKDLNNESAGSSFATSGLTVYYSKTNAYPTTFTEVLSINYYDQYPTGAEPLPASVLDQQTLKTSYQEYNANGITTYRSTKGMLMASYVRASENLDNRWNKNFNWYDAKGRLIGAHSANHLGGYTKSSIALDFAGKTLKTLTQHKRKSTDAEVTVQNRYLYKNQALEKHYHQVNTNPEELLAAYTYNDLGQVINKQVGGTVQSPVQSVDYRYNIRGWLTGVNTDANGALQSGKLFSYKLKYNDPDNADNNPARYNGNISEVDWSAGGGVKRYGYIYDQLNRLVSAKFQLPGATVPEIGSYDETAEYDTNGNITRLSRSAPTFTIPGPSAELIDDLRYTYSGNRVTHIADESNNPSGYPGGGQEIGYDANGNMTAIPDKGFGNMVYNYLNLTKSIQLPDNQRMSYVYLANGNKISKTLSTTDGNTVNTTTTDYLDGFQYTTQNSITVTPEEFETAVAFQKTIFTPVEPEAQPMNTNGVAELQFFATSEGFYDYKNSKYIYQYKDHLGNVRVNYTKDANGVQVIDRNDYYPFGMNHQTNDVGAPVFGAGGNFVNYKYNQKELQETGMYDYGWRQYLPDIGKWNGMDQLAEMYQSFSPYAYVANNPVMLTDPDGRWIEQNGSMSDRSGQTSFLHGQSYQPLLSMGNNSMMVNPLYEYYSGGSGGSDGGIWEGIKSFFGNLFGGGNKNKTVKRSRSGGVVILSPGAYVFEGYVAETAATETVVTGTGLVGGLTLGALLMPTMIAEPEFDWTRQFDKTRDIPITTTGEPSAVEFFYRAMSSKEYLSTGGFLQQKRDQNGNYRGEGPFVTDRLEYAERALNGFSKRDKYDLIVQYSTQLGTTNLLNSISLPHGPGVTGAYSEKLGLPIRKIELGGTNYGFYGANVNIFNARLVSPPMPIRFK